MTETRTTSSTGGQKGVKPQRYSLIPPAALAEIAGVYGDGAAKYDPADQWRKGYEFSKSFDSLQRHLAAWWSGENDDPEFDRSHLAHAAFHVLALLEWTVGPDADEYTQFDDRYVGKHRADDDEEEGDGQVFIAPLGTPIQEGEWTEIGYLDADRVEWGNPALRSLELTVEAEDSVRRTFFPNLKLEEGPGGKFLFKPQPAQVDWSALAKKVTESLNAHLIRQAQALGVDPRPGYNGIWGVGDTVQLVSGALLTRQLGGGWLLSNAVGYGPETSWTDRRITDLVNERGADHSPALSPTKVNAQKRPWRGSGEWSDGDRIIWRFNGMLWGATRRHGTWGSDLGGPAVDFDRQVVDIINGRDEMCELVRITFADCSEHDAGYIADLEEAAEEARIAALPRDPANGVGEWEDGDSFTTRPLQGANQRVYTATRENGGWLLRNRQQEVVGHDRWVDELLAGLNQYHALDVVTLHP